MSLDGRANDSGSEGAGTFGRSRASTPESRGSFKRPSYEVLRDPSPRPGPQPWPVPATKGKQRQLDPSPERSPGASIKSTASRERPTVSNVERPKGPRERIELSQLDPRQHWGEGSAASGSSRPLPTPPTRTVARKAGDNNASRSASGQTFGDGDGDVDGDDSTSSIRSDRPLHDVAGNAPRHPRSSTPPLVLGPTRSRSPSTTPSPAGEGEGGYGVGEGGGAVALPRISRSLTAVQLEEQRRLNQDVRRSGEIDREALARWRQTRSPASPALGALAAATGRGRPKSASIVSGRPISVPMRTSSSASSKEVRRIRTRPQSSSAAQLGFPSRREENLRADVSGDESKERSRTASEPDAVSRAKLRTNPRSTSAFATARPVTAPPSRRSQALSFTPGILPDGTLASTEIPRRDSSHRDRKRWSAGEDMARAPSTPKANQSRSSSVNRRTKKSSPGSPRTSREDAVGTTVATTPKTPLAGPLPPQPVSPTRMPYRYGAGDWFHDGVSPDLSQVYSNRASLSTIWAAQARASAQRHLVALSALQPRFPSRAASLRNLRTRSWLARAHHTTLLLVTYAHVLATLFLDYNTAYALAQLALHPGGGGPRRSGSVWWIAVGLYAGSTVAWLFGVVILWEVIVQYSRRWSKPRPYIMPVYLSSPAFSLTSLRSFSYYSLLYRVRWRATPRDFATETCWWLSQNWPTIITILPRAIIASILTILYHPTSSSPTTSGQRDSVYFQDGGESLSRFAYAVILANLGFMAWRVLLWLLSLIGLSLLSDGKELRSAPTASSSYDNVERHGSPDVTLADRSSRALIGDATVGAVTGDVSQYAAEGWDPEADAVPSLDRKSREALSLRGGWRARAKERIRQALVEAMPAPGDTSIANLAERSFDESGEASADGDEDVEGYEMAERNEESLSVIQAVPMTSVHTATSTATTPALEASEKLPDVTTPSVTSHPIQGLTPRPTSSHKRREKRPRSESPPSLPISLPSAAASTASLAAPVAAAIVTTTSSPTRSPRRSPRPSPPGTAGAEQEVQIQSSVTRPGWIVSEEPDTVPSPVLTSVPLTSHRQLNGRASTESNRGAMLRSSSAHASRETLPEEEEEDESGGITQTKELLDASERSKPSPKATEAKTNWWSMLPGLRTKKGGTEDSTPTIMASGSGGNSVDTGRSSPTVTRPMSRPNSRPASRPTSSASKAPTTNEGGIGTTALLADDSLEGSTSVLPPASTGSSLPTLRVISPAGEDNSADVSLSSATSVRQSQQHGLAADDSQDCSSSISSDDSEERRLWASFPEQSRRHPPGLIALELEQRVFGESPSTKGLGLGIPMTPATAAAMAAVVTAVEALPSLLSVSGSSSSSAKTSTVTAMATANVSPATTSTTIGTGISPGSVAGTTTPTNRTSIDTPRSPSQGGLVAIREESWSSSLDSAASENQHPVVGPSKKTPLRKPLLQESTPR